MATQEEILADLYDLSYLEDKDKEGNLNFFTPPKTYEERLADLENEKRAKIREARIGKYPEPKTDFNINPNLEKFIGQQSVMDKFMDPDYKPADPFQVAAEESFNPARLRRGNMKLQQAIFDNEMKKGSKELKDVSKKKMDKYLTIYFI